MASGRRSMSTPGDALPYVGRAPSRPPSGASLRRPSAAYLRSTPASDPNPETMQENAHSTNQPPLMPGGYDSSQANMDHPGDITYQEEQWRHTGSLSPDETSQYKGKGTDKPLQLLPDMLKAAVHYEALRIYDGDLWETFNHDFRDYTHEDFYADYGSALKLRNFLRSAGVYVRKVNGDLAGPLMEARNDYLQWTPQEAITAANETNFYFRSPTIINMIDAAMATKGMKPLQTTPKSGPDNTSSTGNEHRDSQASRHSSVSEPPLGNVRGRAQQTNPPMKTQPVYTRSDARSDAQNTVKENTTSAWPQPPNPPDKRQERQVTPGNESLPENHTQPHHRTQWARNYVPQNDRNMHRGATEQVNDKRIERSYETEDSVGGNTPKMSQREQLGIPPLSQDRHQQRQNSSPDRYQGQHQQQQQHQPATAYAPYNASHNRPPPAQQHFGYHNAHMPAQQQHYDSRSFPLQQPEQQHRQQAPHSAQEGQQKYDDQNIERRTEKAMNTMTRLYQKEMKYNGHDDCFDQKLEIFYDICDQSGLPKESYRKAFTLMLTGDTLSYYHDNRLRLVIPFDDVCGRIRQNYEGAEYHREALNIWNAVNLQTTMRADPSKPMIDHFEDMISQLQRLQPRLPIELRTSQPIFINKIILACTGVEACRLACFKPAATVEGFINELRSSIRTAVGSNIISKGTTLLADDTDADNAQYFTERRMFNNRDSSRGRSRGHFDRRTGSQKPRSEQPRKCYVCNKVGCWSRNHTREERAKSKQIYLEKLKTTANDHAQIRQFIAELEHDDDEDTGADNKEYYSDHSNEDIIDTYLSFENQDSIFAQSNEMLVSETFFTNIGPVDGQKMTDSLADHAFLHTILRGNDPKCAAPAFSLPRYHDRQFYGIMIDTGAANKSTVGFDQCMAYTKLTDAYFNEATAGQAHIKFGAGPTNTSAGTIVVDMPFGSVTFHVTKTDTPFLLSLADMDQRKVYYNNLTNMLISPVGSFPVVRMFGHPFFLWKTSAHLIVEGTVNTANCYLTDTEIRRLHRRFGHPSVDRLMHVLNRSGHSDIERSALEKLTKHCAYCQKYGKSPGRFRFKLQDDVDFNHSIIIDIIYIDNKPILHIIDEGTRFQAARWLTNMTAKHTWDVLRQCWIDSYLGPPEHIITDARTNFTSKEFKQHASTMGITTKSVPVEAHWSIGLVERYHAVVRRAYQIIQEELAGSGIDRDMALQMAVKAVNDTAGPDGIVPTLLVFGAFPRISTLDPPSPSIAQRAAALSKAMEEVRKLRETRQVADALHQRNGPSTMHLHDLKHGAQVLVWREGASATAKGKWDGPFNFQGIEGETCTLLLPSGPTQFRSTYVKPFYDEQSAEQEDENPSADASDSSEHEEENPAQPQASVEQPHHHLRSGSTKLPRVKWNKDGTIARAYLKLDMNSWEQKQNKEDGNTIFVVDYTKSRKKELDGLMKKGVFKIVKSSEVPIDARIFNCRFVDEIKNKGTPQAYEKSRLVVQAFNDKGKDTILTQSPTIQRCSQRLILALAALLGPTNGYIMFIRDIQQAYVESKTNLVRYIYAYAPPEMGLPPGTILQVVRPLYGIPESGNHWFGTYSKHHLVQLKMSMSTFDTCLLHTSTNGFGVVGLQVDDTIILADEIFAEQEDLQLKKAGFLAKEREVLKPGSPVKFNGTVISLVDGNIELTQEAQCKSLKLIQKGNADIVTTRGKTTKAASPKEQYISQRAKGAYIATMCQPEASFDLSYAAQTLDYSDDDIKALNRRLLWQIENAKRGITFVPLDLESLKLIVFTDASFANNKDFTSQIGYIVAMADKNNDINILHWSSTKCKRVTRSVLASELYAMALGFDMSASMKATIDKILDKQLPLIVCTDSKSLYDCLIKLGTTQEKRLMIDIMALRQSYERREIAEVRWINGESNPADAMTKAKPGKALRDLIDTNKLQMEVMGWVERD